MLKINVQDNRYVLTITCSWCGSPIEQVVEGCYEWQVDDEGIPLDGTIFYSHKECSQTYAGVEIADSRWLSEPLSRLFLLLSGEPQR